MGDPGETGQQVVSLEKYISDFVGQEEPDIKADASQVDIHEELKP
jgi:hypothetical protein